MEIKELNKDLIWQANNNSMFNRGNAEEQCYKKYIEQVCAYNISDEKKQKICDKIYDMCSEILSMEARYVPVTVAGPARYNSSKFSALADRIMEKSSILNKYMEDIDNQIKNSVENDKQEDIDRQVDFIKRLEVQQPDWFKYWVDKELIKLSTLSSEKFIEMFEYYNNKIHFRKNMKVYKLYEEVKNGGSNEIVEKQLFENDDYKIIEKQDRIFIKFIMRPARQLIVALKSRGYWWNSREGAWSTYLKKYDSEWAENISTQYKKYI